VTGWCANVLKRLRGRMNKADFQPNFCEKHENA